jgi:hypothetical protein
MWGNMKTSLVLAIAILIAADARAQEFVRSKPAGRQDNVFVAVSTGLAAETRATARDFVTFRDRNWSLLTLAQIAASTADAQTSLRTFHSCPACTETGISRFVVGRRPDAHKYIIAGLIEIGVEGVAAHYLRNHGPARKWYWRYVWALPQMVSLAAHTHAAFHNNGLQFNCDSTGMNCY